MRWSSLTSLVVCVDVKQRWNEIRVKLYTRRSPPQEPGNAAEQATSVTCRCFVHYADTSRPQPEREEEQER